MVWGEIAKERVLVQIDSGASHNFISTRLLQKLQLQIDPTLPYWSKVGGGQWIKTSGVCGKLKLQLQQLTFKEDFYVLSLDGEDIILGKEWLENLGDMKANFKELSMRVKREGVKYIIKGDPTLCKGEVSTRTIIKELQEVLAEFEDFFKAHRVDFPKGDMIMILC